MPPLHTAGTLAVDDHPSSVVAAKHREVYEFHFTKPQTGHVWLRIVAKGDRGEDTNGDVLLTQH